MNNIKKKYLVVALLTLSMSTTAQIEKNEWGFPKTYIPDLRQNSRVTTSVFFNDILHVGLEDNFKVEELRSIDPKMRNMKYEQYYKGLKVMESLVEFRGNKCHDRSQGRKHLAEGANLLA